MRPRPTLFSPVELMSAEVLKAQLEWMQQERKRAQAEEQRLFANVAFDYEPFNYPWCGKYTRLEDVRRASEGDDTWGGHLGRLVVKGGCQLNERCTPVSRRRGSRRSPLDHASSLAGFLARLGCTRIGSPGILG
jgi:hypothetical protein